MMQNLKNSGANQDAESAQGSNPHAYRQATGRRGKALWLCVLVAGMLTLFVSTPALAASTSSTQQAQQAQPDQPSISHAPPCPGMVDNQGQCVLSMPTPLPSFTPGNKQIRNPIANHSPLLFFTPPQYTVDQPIVAQLWTVSLWIVDICLALVLALNGIAIMLGGSLFRYAKAVESLPGVLLALIAAHISMLFMSFFISTNNGISTNVFNWVDNLSVNAQAQLPTIQYKHCGPINTVYTHDTDTIQCHHVDGAQFDITLGDLKTQTKNMSTCQTVQTQSAGQAGEIEWDDCTTIPQTIQMDHFTITPQNLDLSQIDIPTAVQSLGGSIGLMITVTSLMLIAQVIIRLFYLDLYIVLAPIGIACWALAGAGGSAYDSFVVPRLPLHGLCAILASDNHHHYTTHPRSLEWLSRRRYWRTYYRWSLAYPRSAATDQSGLSLVYLPRPRTPQRRPHARHDGDWTNGNPDRSSGDV